MIIWDLKTANDAHPKAFRYAVKRYRYDLQAYHYCRVMSLVSDEQWTRFQFAVVCSVPPHRVEVFRVSDETMAAAGVEWRELVAQYVQGDYSFTTGEMFYV